MHFNISITDWKTLKEGSDVTINSEYGEVQLEGKIFDTEGLRFLLTEESMPYLVCNPETKEYEHANISLSYEERDTVRYWIAQTSGWMTVVKAYNYDDALQEAKARARGGAVNPEDVYYVLPASQEDIDWYGSMS